MDLTVESLWNNFRMFLLGEIGNRQDLFDFVGKYEMPSFPIMPGEKILEFKIPEYLRKLFQTGEAVIVFCEENRNTMTIIELIQLTKLGTIFQELFWLALRQTFPELRSVQQLGIRDNFVIVDCAKNPRLFGGSNL